MTNKKKKSGSNSASPSQLLHIGDNLKSPLEQQSTKPSLPTAASTKVPNLAGSQAHSYTYQPPLPRPKLVSDGYIVDMVQTIPGDLRICLDHDFQLKRSQLTQLQLYCLLFHFNPKISGQPTHKIDSLFDKFISDVQPLISSFISPPPPPPEVLMQTDSNDDDKDFDPRGRKITHAMLAGVITKRDPKFNISTSARTEQLLWLYKDVVDPQLPLAKNTKFSYIPRVLKGQRIKEISIEELRHALQVYAPHIFVHTVGLTKSTLVNMYLKFIAEEPLPENHRLVLGYHYAIIPKA